MKKNIFVRPVINISVLLFILLLPCLVNAQVSDPGGDVDAPVDGGLSLLVAAGVGYGVKKLKEKRKKNALS